MSALWRQLQPILVGMGADTRMARVHARSPTEPLQDWAPYYRLAASVLACALAAWAAPSNKELDASFRGEIQPLLDTYCSSCHGEELKTAGIVFSEFEDLESVVRSRSIWLRALRVLRENEMPPMGEQPSVQERQRMVEWIDNAVNHLDWSEFRHPGSVTLARLNRTEYNNTIRDLTGLDMRLADSFPTDGQGDSGFRNDRDGLFVAPVLVEKYFAAASEVVDELIASRAAGGPFSARLELEDFLLTETNHPRQPYGFDLINQQQTVYRYVTFPRFANYTIRVRAWGVSARRGTAPGLTVRLDGTMIGQVHVIAPPDEPHVYSFQTNIPSGSHRISLHWYTPKTQETNDHNRRLVAEAKRAREAAIAAGKKPRGQESVVVSLDWVEVEETAGAGAEGPLVWVAEPQEDVPARTAARQVLARFAERAYRSPVETSEIERLLAVYDSAASWGETYEQAVGLALKSVLVSPRFLFRPEVGGKASTDYQLNDYELASRLSYFLWMSMPDQELMDLARAGKLRSPTVLDQQITRMLADGKAQSFMETFFAQWLGYAELGGAIKPDREEFPQFSPRLGEAMTAEATLLFDRIVREDRSLLELLDADYTHLNEELAKHYGIRGVVGREMRRVDLKDKRRGGILGLGAVLTATSLPNRTSPVVRGKWVLETMFGEELPPPLPDAGELPEPGKSTEGMTLRQVFEMHRSQERCAVCHERIDPIGFGLENFDGIGRWRQTDNNQPVDARGTLPGGESFEGPVELKAILLEKKEEFARMVSAQTLKFALGRDLEYFDEPAVQEITQAVIRSDYSAKALISATVSSYPFRYRRGMPKS